MRQWRLWRTLAQVSTPISAADLARRLGPEVPHVRTVRRDLEVLRTVGAPVQQVKRGRECLYTIFGDGPPLALDADTVLSLRLALDLLRPFDGTPIVESLEHLFAALASRVSRRLLAHFAPLLRGVIVRPGGAPSYGRSRVVLETIEKALEGQVTLEIEHQPLTAAKTTRTVHPQALVYGPKGLYLFAYDERSQAPRTFRVDRIAKAALGAGRAREAAEDPKEYFSGSVGIYSPEHEPTRFVLHVHDDAVAQTLLENPLHESQEVVRHEGGFRVALILRSSRELVSRVLALAPAVEAVEPESFREAVKARHTASLERYRAATEKRDAGPTSSATSAKKVPRISDQS